MNLDCLGNSADHFKGSLLRRLFERRLLNELAVDPLINDFPRWDEGSLKLYSDLVGIQLQPGQTKSTTLAGRRRRPGIPGHLGDLFLDPTTGVAYGKQEGDRYVHPDEVRALLVASNVVAAYQYTGRSGPLQIAVLAMNAVRGSAKDIYASAYDGGSVSILFFSRDYARIEAIGSELRNWLGVASGRIM